MYSLLIVYLSNVKQFSFLKKLCRKVTNKRQGHIILCGDFNAIPDRDLDLSSASVKRQYRATLTNFIASSNLFNVWQCQHAMEKYFTFFSQAHRSYSRIDLFLIDKFLLQNVTKSEIYMITWSDHAPVSINVGENHAETRANRWRNDISLLSHPEHKIKIAKELVYRQRSFILWNAHKAYIRGLLIKLSSIVKKRRAQQLNNLLNTIKHLESANNNSTSQLLRDQLARARHDPRSLLPNTITTLGL